MSAVFETQIKETDFIVTPAAESKLEELMSDTDDDVNAIRVFVTGGGCGGMTYGMTFTDQQTAWDTVREFGSFRLLVDAVAMNYMRGAEIDFVERPTGASFVFNNVFQATGGSGTCGTCGSAGGGCG